MLLAGVRTEDSITRDTSSGVGVLAQAFGIAAVDGIAVLTAGGGGLLTKRARPGCCENVAGMFNVDEKACA